MPVSPATRGASGVPLRLARGLSGPGWQSSGQRRHFPLRRQLCACPPRRTRHPQPGGPAPARSCTDGGWDGLWRPDPAAGTPPRAALPGPGPPSSVVAECSCSTRHRTTRSRDGASPAQSHDPPSRSRLVPGPAASLAPVQLQSADAVTGHQEGVSPERPGRVGDAAPLLPGGLGGVLGSGQHRLHMLCTNEPSPFPARHRLSRRPEATGGHPPRSSVQPRAVRVP